MSIHPSLSGSGSYVTQRSVLKRLERIKDLLKKGTFKEGDSVLGLPKTKVLKIKAKKSKGAPEKEADADKKKAKA